MKMNKIITNLVLVALFLSIITSVIATEYSSDNARIEVTLVNQIPDPVEPGDIVDVRFRIENTGAGTLSNLKFEIMPEFPFTLYEGEVEKDLGSIDAYQTGADAYIIKYKLRVSDVAVSGDNTLKAKYTLNNGGTYVELDDFTITVNEYEPVVELVSATTNPEVAIPGEDIELTLRVKSLSSAQIRDVKLSLDIEDTTTTTYYFAPIGSANEQVIEVIGAGQEKEVVFTLATSPDTPIDVEKIPLTMTYYDDDGTEYTKSYIVGVKMYEKPSYTLALEDKTIYKELQKGTVTFSIADIGKTNLNYLEIELMEQPLYYTILSSNKVYIGNLESDDFDTAEFEIYSEDSVAGKLPLKIKVKYKDNYGKYFEKTEEIDVELYNKRQLMKYGIEAPPGAGAIFNIMLLIIVSVFWVSMIMNLRKNKMPKGKKILWWIILIGTYVIGGILYYLMARKKNKK
jgi:hypothetical protein